MSGEDCADGIGSLRRCPPETTASRIRWHGSFIVSPANGKRDERTSPDITHSSFPLQKGAIMKTSILSACAALVFGTANLPSVQADHHHHDHDHRGSGYRGDGGYGHHHHHHHGHRTRFYGGYGYVQPYNYGWAAPAPAPVYVYPSYPTYYPQSGASFYGKNFGFSFSN